ncbi:MAG: tetratricopeptide repeat protein [Syntrophobacterales bacterium]|nr:tetratricopeptide repeat protein [Syntrophobacterales bacterium]
MSYINEALRKAQAEKDNCYGKVDYAASLPPARRRRPWQKPMAIFAATIVIVAAGTLLAVKFFLAPVSVAPKPPVSSAERGTAFAGSTGKQEALPMPKPAAVLAADDAARKTSVAKPAAAASKKVQDEKKAVEIKRRQEEAALAQRSGNFSTAKTLYGEILTLDEDNVEALNNLGVVYLSERKSDKALALFRRAVLLKRDYVDPYYNMACLYAQKNDIDQSLWYLKIAISIDKEVMSWVKKDADMKKVVASPKFKGMDGGVRN